MNTPDILKQIVEAKRPEVERLKTVSPLSSLESRIQNQDPPLNLAGSLLGQSIRVIAEIKKASPTKGVLRTDFDPVALAATYAENGAAAISVLTNIDHFQGSIQHMEAARVVVNPLGLPILRKEFLFDPYQIYESRAHGADAVLLITAILSSKSLKELLHLAKSLWMQCLVEVHDEEELRIALDAGSEIIGINNRNLHTFNTELEVTERLAPMIPRDKVIVSESGISNREDLQRIKSAGAHAALVGESLLTAIDVGAKLRELT